MIRPVQPSRTGRRFMRWSILLAVNGLFLFVVGTATVRETIRDWQVNQEIQGMQAEADALEGKRTQLVQTIQDMTAGGTLDKEARAHLGLKKPGEHVIILRGTDGETFSWQEANEPTTTTATPTLSNPNKWLRYFFHPPTDTL